MTTPAFPDSILTKIRAGHQATRFRAILGDNVQFRAFCCDLDSDDVMGVSKTPVVHLDLTPNPVCLGNSVSYSMAGSYAPGSAIVSYSIDMGDGTEYSNQSGSHTYAAVGTYNVVARVVEGLGKYQTAEAQVTVVDCSTPMLMTYTYISTYGDGVYYIDWTVAVPAWVARNTGLTANGMYVNSMIMNPATNQLPDTVQELWIATLGGVFRTFSGGRSWAKIPMPNPDNSDFGDVPPATADQLNYICVRLSPKTANIVYVLAALDSPQRTWMYRSANAGITWTSKGIM